MAHPSTKACRKAKLKPLGLSSEDYHYVNGLRAPPSLPQLSHQRVAVPVLPRQAGSTHRLQQQPPPPPAQQQRARTGSIGSGGALLAGNSRSTSATPLPAGEPFASSGEPFGLAGSPALRGTASLPALHAGRRDPRQAMMGGSSDGWAAPRYRAAAWSTDADAVRPPSRTPVLSEEAALEAAERLLEEAARHLPYMPTPADDMQVRQAVAHERRLLTRRMAQRILREARREAPPEPLGGGGGGGGATCCGVQLATPPLLHPLDGGGGGASCAAAAPCGGAQAAAAGPMAAAAAAAAGPVRLPEAVLEELARLATAFCELSQALTIDDVQKDDGAHGAWNPHRVPARPRLRPRSPRHLWLRREEPAERPAFKVRPSLATLAPGCAAFRERPLIARYNFALGAAA